MQINIAKTSPLYEFWMSMQSEADEEKRLIKISKEESNASLFILEPYKWEVLYRSSVINISRGDLDYIYSLNLLLSMLCKEERYKTISSLKKGRFFRESAIEKLEKNIVNSNHIERKAINFTKFIRVLFAIFTNIYCIPIKKKPDNLYEQTALISITIKSLFD